MQHVLALDLQDDPQLIAAYEAHHCAVWPEVRAHLRRQGVAAMTIYRLGTRLVMLMTTDDERYDPVRMAAEAQTDPIIRRWEELMWNYQARTPWTPEGRKWVAMLPIFELGPDEAG
jgi:L-rhamnose mutarotase